MAGLFPEGLGHGEIILKSELATALGGTGLSTGAAKSFSIVIGKWIVLL